MCKSADEKWWLIWMWECLRIGKEQLQLLTINVSNWKMKLMHFWSCCFHVKGKPVSVRWSETWTLCTLLCVQSSYCIRVYRSLVEKNDPKVALQCVKRVLSSHSVQGGQSPISIGNIHIVWCFLHRFHVYIYATASCRIWHLFLVRDRNKQYIIP